jgi:DNA-binding PadR family transcriptional regulator
MAYQRLQNKITKENLWLYILRILMDQSMYAYALNKKIKETFKFTTATVTVYVVLYKMRREGLIRLLEEKKSEGKRIRKYYEITEKGRENFLKGTSLLKDTLRMLA